MRPEDLVTLRDGILHTQREFAALLSLLRGAPVSARTVEGWELGRGKRDIPVYLTDVAAIERATKPQSRKCECGAGAVVRKDEADLCSDCAEPVHQGGR